MAVSPNERLLVLASDGVFDVLSNQEVVDICFQHRSDPAQACISLINKSHNAWLLNDDCDEDQANYDDMTCIVIFFDNPEQADALPPSLPAPLHSKQEQGHRKRVRQKTLQNLEELKVSHEVSETKSAHASP
jgi:serine/threonine protein phosphatase PrpC